LRLGKFGELLYRREALDRRREHGVGIGVAIGRAISFARDSAARSSKLHAF
jgi:hypothetical protein